MAMAADVSRIDDVRKLELAVRQRFGGIDVLMNNAGVQPGSGMFGPAANWTVAQSFHMDLAPCAPHEPVRREQVHRVR
jgi:NAD(P)-dependent dehydrogenase (short-subunit alcohol dehydrogenase family)